MNPENIDIISYVKTLEKLNNTVLNVVKRQKEFKELIEKTLKQKDRKEFIQMDWVIAFMGKIEEFLVDIKVQKEEREEMKLFFNKNLVETLKKHGITTFCDLYEKTFPADKFLKKPANYVSGKAHINRFKELMRRINLNDSDISPKTTVSDLIYLNYVSNSFFKIIELGFPEKTEQEIKNMTLEEILSKNFEYYKKTNNVPHSGIKQEINALKFLLRVPIKE